MLVKAKNPQTGEERTLNLVDFREYLKPAGWELLTGVLGGGPGDNVTKESLEAAIQLKEATEAAVLAKAAADAGLVPVTPEEAEAAQVEAARAELKAGGIKLAPNLKPETLFAKLADFRAGKLSPEGKE